MTRPQPPPWQRDVILADGTSLRLRPIRPDDDARMLALFDRLSPATIQNRFMAAVRRFSETEVQRFTHVDYADEMALVAVAADGTAPGGERIIAVGRYVRLADPRRAEVAFTVEDGYQGLGIGTHLLQELLPFARQAGVEVLEAEVLAHNQAMLRVFQHMGFAVTARHASGTVHIEFPFAATRQSQERRWAREEAARAAAMERLFRPRSVAVVGASGRAGKVGHGLVQNLLAGGFTGAVYPVNPRRRRVLGLPCFRSLAEVPGPVDLVVVAVRAAAVPEAVEACVRKGAYAALVVSAGFAERDAAGRALQARVQEIARRGRLRLVGPASLGLLNTEPAVALHATFAPAFPPAGRVAFSSQSGALGIAFLHLARELRLGLSQFIALGNRADVSSNDLLAFWGRDAGTDVILLYLESFGNPRKFSRIARAVGRSKPIVALKSGTTPAGVRAAATHTASRPLAPAVVRTLMDQAGIVQADTMEHLFHAAKVFGTQPLPRGNRLAIVTNAGGPGILSADRAEAEGLAVPVLSPALQARLSRGTAGGPAVGNPVDLLGTATPARYRTALRAILASGEVDQVAVQFIPAVVADAEGVARAIVAAHREAGRGIPLVASMLSPAGDTAGSDLLEAAGIPTFRFPEDAVWALGRLTRYQAWRSAPQGAVVRFEDCDREAAARLVHAAADPAAAAGPGVDAPAPTPLGPLETCRLLESYGLRCLPTRWARTPAEAVRCAAALGHPVRLRPTRPGTPGAPPPPPERPRGLGSATAVRAAFRSWAAWLEGQGRSVTAEGLLVQALPPVGPAVSLGMETDEQFGPVLRLGPAGRAAPAGAPGVALGLHPLTDGDAAAMVARVREGTADDPAAAALAAAAPALAEALLRLSQLVGDHPQVHAVRLKPVLSHPGDGALLVAGGRVDVVPVAPFQAYVLSLLDG